MRSLLPFVLMVSSLLAAVSSPAAESGVLTGVVLDWESKEELIGVDIVLVGTGEKTMTDIEGRFRLEGLRPGLYDLRASYLGYNTRFVGGVEIAAGGETNLEVSLENFRAHQTDDMVVTASRVLNTDSGLMAERQQSAVIGDAISSAQISRSPDGTSGDALKRVPGLTVNDGKYVYVRGVTDRYNVTEVNGVRMSGTNVSKDRKSFNFDMVPANLLANITVIKSATPDLPGDFAGGLVRITTLEFPAKATTSIGVSAAFTGGVTGETMHYDANEGGDDWIGLDDGSRDFPRELLDESVLQPGYGTRNQALARALPNSWSSKTKTAPWRRNFNFSHGNRFSLLGSQVGYMAAGSYRTKYEIDEEMERRQPVDTGDGTVSGQDILAEGRSSHAQVTWGGMANLFWRAGRHRIGFTNTINHDATSVVTSLAGYDSDKNFEWETQEWQERRQFVSKLDGKHRLPLRLDFDWQFFYGESEAVEPDRRYLGYNTDNEIAVMNENMRTWSWLDERVRGHALDLAWSPADDEFEKQFNPELKVGYRHEERDRDFDVEAWYTTPTFRTDGQFKILPPDSIFAPENYNEVSDPRRGTGWEFAQDDNNSGVYSGRHDLTAWYAMADWPFELFQEDLRLTGGVRQEDSDQFVETQPRRNFPDQRDTARVDVTDLLSSAAATWLYDEKTNVRISYYESVNRPQFREMAPVLRRNFRTFQNELGNADLQRAEIRNYDIRLEHFPDYGEVLAVSVFYKDIRNAIEDTLYSSPERTVKSWSNAPEATNRGFEIEVRRKLDFWSPLDHFTLSTNYTRVWSDVDFVRRDGTPDTRKLAGQAPWSLNAGLAWQSNSEKTTANLLFNRVGKYLDSIADSEFDYVDRLPRSRLDLVVTHRFWKKFRLKAAMKDILAEDTILESGPENDRYVYSRLTEDPEYSISLSAKF